MTHVLNVLDEIRILKKQVAILDALLLRLSEEAGCSIARGVLRLGLEYR